MYVRIAYVAVSILCSICTQIDSVYIATDLKVTPDYYHILIDTNSDKANKFGRSAGVLITSFTVFRK